MSVCFIEININKILPIFLLKLANNLTFVRQPFSNELVIITNYFNVNFMFINIVISHKFLNNSSSRSCIFRLTSLSSSIQSSCFRISKCFENSNKIYIVITGVTPRG